jgi:hypothetical protein
VKSATKILAILFCLLLCAGGTMLTRKENTKAIDPKTHLAPVINHEPKRPIWILV